MYSKSCEFICFFTMFLNIKLKDYFAFVLFSEVVERLGIQSFFLDKNKVSFFQDD